LPRQKDFSRKQPDGQVRDHVTSASFDFQNSPVSGHDAAWTMRTDF
jgi:hypothetical protein